MIEKHIPKLETCQTLKELGLKQRGLFCYYKHHSGGGFEYQIEPMVKERHTEDDYNFERHVVFAPTVGELGEMLPIGFDSCRPIGGFWKCYPSPKYPDVHLARGNTEAEARAEMLIHLIENDFVDNKWKQEWLNG